ncbi:hypothetical protein J5J10_11760 [Ciceribacter sp. L1K23]|uniref:sunset domain-containing protein n=1 Tax=Ciceribacter sp. L1K23 TaxID=2820276 RepID=UPI001B83DEDE|nr:hypothetical protein [Ciceribacter sp. L1K23]MBR0556354.1 hypothetical protein [Ciceribacter sp. L1K23]
MDKFALLVGLLMTTVFMATGGYTLLPREWYDPSCDIKGNISINSREKIYHVRGQEDYWATNIQPQHGERWFCSEEDALAAGWRKATR